MELSLRLSAAHYELSLSVEEMFPPPSSSLVVVPSDRDSIKTEEEDLSSSCPMTSITPSKSSSLLGVTAMLPSSSSSSSSSSDEYRCHCCPNVSYGQCSLLFDHFFDRNHLIEEKSKIVVYLCWKKGCNQYFPSLSSLEKHFRSIHLSSSDSSVVVGESRLSFVHRCRERLFSIGEDVVEHYLENLTSSTGKNEISCDLCSKTFSTFSRLKVHYEEIHFIRLSSSAIEHWIFLVDKLHQSSPSVPLPTTPKKKKRELVRDSMDSSSTKRQRTRISDEQLLILRDHFDLNHSPCDEQIEFIARKTDLTVKVIKHWFRNTLFKERQRNKDSPYNFSNPPTTLNQFDLDEYHKTGTIIPKPSPPVVVLPLPPPPEQHFTSDCDTDEEEEEDDDEEEEDLLSNSDSNEDLRPVPVLPAPVPTPVPPLTPQQQSRRANRTRFTDEQLRYLQDAFEGNPYPKDDDLEILSQKLKLNSRVIVVWFQNARQKARKSYENNQNDSPSPLQMTTTTPMIVEPAIKQEKDEGYSCKNCSKLFVRFAELMKHAKQCSSPSFFNPKKTLKKVEFPSSLLNDLPSSSSRPLKYSCDQCEKCFSSLTFLTEHQSLHMQQALLNAAAFFPLAAAAAYHPAAAACAAAMAALNSQLFHQQTPKSVSSIGSDSSNEMEEEDGGTSLDSSDSVSPRKLSLSTNGKRNRTTILPEQQDFLLSRYSLESNPSRKMLEEISSQVKLKKRVVQVWFQNTRARERKGNMKIEHSTSNLEKKHPSIVSSKMIKPSLDELPLDLSKSSRLTLPSDDVEEEEEEEEWSDHSTDDEQEGENEEEEESTISTKKVSSRLNGVEVMSPSGSQQSLSGQRRFRTQMSPLQIKLMKSIFLEYRTPTMPECELLGKEISLQKRVVQVWFQNARAKEKKNPHFFKSDLPEQFQPSQQSCLLCQHKYTIDHPQRDHLFTSTHIDNLRCQFIDPRLSKSLDESNEKNSQPDLSGQQQQLTSFPSSSTVFDQNNKDQLISYFNLMNFLPLGLDPFNYGLMDPNIHGTPIFMLQLPCEAIEKILSSMKTAPLLSRTEYSQDGFHHQRRRTHPKHCQTIDVGFLCKRCHLVWPLYESCRCHALMCWQLSPSLIPLTLTSSGESNCLAEYMLKIEQCLYRCPTCERSYPTWREFDQHLQDETNQLCKSNSSNSTIQENDSNEL